MIAEELMEESLFAELVLISSALAFSLGWHCMLCVEAFASADCTCMGSRRVRRQLNRMEQRMINDYARENIMAQLIQLFEVFIGQNSGLLKRRRF